MTSRINYHQFDIVRCIRFTTIELRTRAAILTARQTWTFDQFGHIKGRTFWLASYVEITAHIRTLEKHPLGLMNACFVRVGMKFWAFKLGAIFATKFTWWGLEKVSRGKWTHFTFYHQLIPVTWTPVKALVVTGTTGWAFNICTCTVGNAKRLITSTRNNTGSVSGITIWWANSF